MYRIISAPPDRTQLRAVSHIKAEVGLKSKVVVAIVLAAEQETAELRRWLSENCDVRTNSEIATDIPAFIDGASV
jgi:hypothetical protein